MRKILGMALIGIVGIGAFSGCVKSSSTSTPTGSMKATVGSTAFNSTICSATGSSGQPFYYISASSGSTTISVDIRSNNIAVGSYTIDASGTNSTASYTGNSVKNAQSGTIVVSSVTAGVNVTGTFNFTCTDGTVVSGGTFNAVF